METSRTSRPLQFSLGTLLLAITFVAVGSAAGRSSVLAFGHFLIPGLVCGGIGIIRGRLQFWLSYAILLELLILGLVFALSAD
ncbi:MAG TPA: hypothetical protein VHX65_15665 [Pirellulales bacterium]|jgi:hypothetical protein|nr:hypothetical protein [Pirellulales bacterium]